MGGVWCLYIDTLKTIQCDLTAIQPHTHTFITKQPRSYSYWFFQFYVGADVCRLLGRSEEEAAAGAGAVENGVILNKIETMTGTRVLVAPHDPASWRRCFVLLGEEELITRALTLLSGAITQGAAPTREGVRQVMALHHDPNDPLLERDARLEEIRKELKEVHKLRMVEMQVRSTSRGSGRGRGRACVGIVEVDAHPTSIITCFIPIMETNNLSGTGTASSGP